ncbi:hypothetical protein BV20DRAFT_968615 [Pilatotrama ljubarskyi]|nr:hypothetical protein BV20DRAFT_968615 [Pilatotrama ljubarskyi]
MICRTRGDDLLKAITRDISELREILGSDCDRILHALRGSSPKAQAGTSTQNGMATGAGAQPGSALGKRPAEPHPGPSPALQTKRTKVNRPPDGEIIDLT